MRIILIRPRNKGNINTRLPESLNRSQGELPPLGISYIAASLEDAGHRVKILDATALNLTSEKMRQQIQEFSPEMAGISTMTSTFFGALEAARASKESGAVTVLGGPQLSAYPRETLSYSYIDYGVNGEGEYVMPELAAALEKGAPADKIKGLVYKKNGEVLVNEPAIVDDLDALPFPAYHLLPMAKYDSIIGDHPVSTMITTRGCPYRCHFCSKQPADEKFRFRSPVRVVDEMEYLKDEFRIREIMFYDDVMTFRRQHVAGVCEEILARGLRLKWEAPARVDNIDGALLQLMRRAGCIRLRYGVESGNEATLGLMDKKVGLAEIRRAFALTRQSGIETFAYFMIGYAHEDEAAIIKTIDFSLELDPDLVMFTITTPYPRTALYEMARQEGLVKNDYWREFTLGNTGGERIPYFHPEVDKWAKKAYCRFYFRPRYIARKISRVRSPGDIIKCFKGSRAILGVK